MTRALEWLACRFGRHDERDFHTLSDGRHTVICTRESCPKRFTAVREYYTTPLYPPGSGRHRAELGIIKSDAAVTQSEIDELLAEFERYRNPKPRGSE